MGRADDGERATHRLHGTEAAILTSSCQDSRGARSALSLRADSPHIGAMARKPDDAGAARKRRSPPHRFHDASEPLESGGFAEAPQPALEGVPYAGSVSDWARDLERAAEDEAGKAEMRAIRSRPASIASAWRTSRTQADEIGQKIPERSAAPTRTGRGTSMGGAASARDRAAAGLNPVAGLDVSLEMPTTLLLPRYGHRQGAVDLIHSVKSAAHRTDSSGRPHRPFRPQKSEGGIAIQMETEYTPSGDQPTAIKDLVEGVSSADRTQVLLGVTGSGKTFTMAKVIEQTQRPALILAPEQDAGRTALRRVQEFLPRNAVEYFVLLLRLLPAGGLRPANRHLYREGNRRSTSRSTGCATRPRGLCSNATTSSSSLRVPASTVSAR